LKQVVKTETERVMHVSTTQKLPSRWLIAIMGTVLQITLGTIYAWSFFQNPLIARSAVIAGVPEKTKAFDEAKANVDTKKLSLAAAEEALATAMASKKTKAITEAEAVKVTAVSDLSASETALTTAETELNSAKKNVWSNQKVAWILSLAICFLGLAAMLGGKLLPKYGPRKLAIAGAILYGSGWVLGGLALSMNSIAFLYIGLGVIGGIGLGLGYVTPVATAAKWFPDKKGFITGMVVMGFGLGALFMSKIFAPTIIKMFTDAATSITNWPMVFYVIGAVLGVPGLIAALTFQNPPAGYVPEGYTPPAASAASNAQDNLTVKQCLTSAPFWKMWFFFFCNITAGIMFIGFQSPLLQDLLKAKDATMTTAALAAAGATLIAISSLFNGIGRFFWGGLSDKIGRAQAFRLILGSQIVVFLLLTQVANPIIFSILVCYILLCYGGGFGTAPSFVTTVFGPKVMAVVYGTLLTAWSTAGLLGPQIAAYFKDTYGPKAANYTFIAGAIFLTLGLIVALMTTNKEYAKK